MIDFDIQNMLTENVHITKNPFLNLSDSHLSFYC